MTASKTIREVAPDGAWTWFNDERAIFHEGLLYTGFVLKEGLPAVACYDPSTGESQTVALGSEAARQQDDHNNPSLTVLADGRILAIYARHHQDFFYFYRISRNTEPRRPEDWGPEEQLSTPDKVTYSNAYRLRKEGNRVYNFFRGVNFNPGIAISDDNGKTWADPVHLFKTGENNVRPYTRYASNGEDRIDVIYTDGHPRDLTNSIYHFYYKEGGVYRTDGSLIRRFEDLPFDHDGGERGTVIYPYRESEYQAGEGPEDYLPFGRGWVWDIHYGADGHPVCVYQALPVPSESGGEHLPAWPDSRIHYYYGRWTGSEWETHCIAHAGRGLYEVENFYAGGISLDPEDPRVVYFSSNARQPFEQLGEQEDIPLNPKDRYELWRGVTEDGGRTFAWEALTEDSAVDNLRPIVPLGHGFDRHVLWFRGHYPTFKSYDCEVVGIFA